MCMGAVSYKDMFASPPLPSPSPNAIRGAAGLLAPIPPPPLTPLPSPPPIEFGTVFSKLARS
jgi:hypothetical protein